MSTLNRWTGLVFNPYLLFMYSSLVFSNSQAEKLVQTYRLVVLCKVRRNIKIKEKKREIGLQDIISII